MRDDDGEQVGPQNSGWARAHADQGCRCPLSASSSALQGHEDVLLDPVQIAFDKNWDPNEDQLDISRHVSASEIEELKTAMATLFREAFSKELAKGGYKVVDQIGQNTLRVSAGLVDVYITALTR